MTLSQNNFGKYLMKTNNSCNTLGKKLKKWRNINYLRIITLKGKPGKKMQTINHKKFWLSKNVTISKRNLNKYLMFMKNFSSTRSIWFNFQVLTVRGIYRLIQNYGDCKASSLVFSFLWEHAKPKFIPRLSESSDKKLRCFKITFTRSHSISFPTRWWLLEHFERSCLGQKITES